MSDKVYDPYHINDCPKCGSRMFDGPNEISWYPDPPGWQISCEDCKYCLNDYSEKDVIREWNKKIEETPIENSRKKLKNV